MRISARRRSLALVVILIVSVATLPGVASAQSGIGGSIVVEDGETVDGIQALAGTIVVRGTVDGDISAAAGDITIAESGRVTGNVQVATGRMNIAGTVDGNVQAGAGVLDLESTGRVGGNLEVGAETVRIAGTVNGNARIGADRIVLDPNGTIDGDLTYDGTLQGDQGIVSGDVVRDRNMGSGIPFGTAFGDRFDLLLGLYGLLVSLLLGGLMLVVAPRFSDRVAMTGVDTPLTSGAVGIVALIGIPIVLILVAITIIGIPLALIGIVLFLLLVWLGTIFGRIAIGSWILTAMDTENRWAALLIGFLVVEVIIRIPWIGGVLNFLVLLLGLGAVSMVTVRGIRGRSSGNEDGTPSEPS